MTAKPSTFSQVLALVAHNELQIVLLLAPLMLFPGKLSFIAPLVIGVVWLARRATYGYFTRRSLMNWPVALLLGMAIIGYFVSVDRQLSEPKLWGIFLQAVLFFSVLNGLHSWKGVQVLSWGVVVLTLGIALLSLVGTNWDVVRFAPFPQLYDHLPRLIRNIPDSGLSPGQDLFHPREVGAALGMLLPFVTAVMLFGSSRWLRFIPALALVTGEIVLLLSQALMGLLGLLVGWAILALWWRRWMMVPILLAGLSVAIVANVLAPDNWVALLLATDNPVGIGVVLRLDMWSRALAMIADMAFTGVGLNTFPLIQTHFYPGHLLGAEPHAHNLFLQTAVDLGVPGLLGLLWLLVAFYLTAWRTSGRVADRPMKALLIASVAGVTAYVAGGLLDVMTLGAKPVAALSLFLGLVGALSWLPQGGVALAGGESVPIDLRPRLAGLAAPGLILFVVVVSMALYPGKLLSNRALIPAHQAIFAARQTGSLPKGAAMQATEWLPKAIQSDPANPELYGEQASLLAWQDSPAAALEALGRRVALDGQNPMGYAPFLAWQDRLAGWPAANEWESLLRIYRQWQARYPQRAEYYSLLSLVYERHLGDTGRAIDLQRQALDQEALPQSLIEQYHAMLTGQSSGTNEQRLYQDSD